MRAYERLLNYVRVYTTSDPESGTHPSAAREFDLAHQLVEELKALGVEDARVDEHCYVYGSLPATPGCEDKPALGLIAHMDTAPDASGENVNPILHENYDGSDVTLPATGMVMKVSAFPFLASMKGETLITTDGTTLLGADDKAGVAEIMTAVETVLEKGLPHGKLCIAFTPDEEIGEGASLFDIPGFGADFAYTVDGGDAGSVEYENFNAAAATVTIHGFSVHPGSAKDTMINASNVAMEFHQALPVMARPETTEGRQGFYHLCQMYGDVTTAKAGLHPPGPRRRQAAVQEGQPAGHCRVPERQVRCRHRGSGDQGQLPQHAGKDQAPLPSRRDRPQGHPYGRAGTGRSARARRHRRRNPELDGPALPQPGHRRLQLPWRVRVHHCGADGPLHPNCAEHHRPVRRVISSSNIAKMEAVRIRTASIFA